MLNQVDVGITDHILGNEAGLHAELWLIEVFQEGFKVFVTILCLSEVGLAVKVDIAEHPCEFAPVASFNVVKHDVDRRS